MAWGIALLWPSPVSSLFLPFSRTVSRMLAYLFSVLPFSVFEWIVLCLVLWGLFLLARLILRLIRAGKRGVARRSLLARAAASLTLAVAATAFCFTFLWGLNYAAPPLSETFDLPVEPRGEEFLKEATLQLLAQANRLSEQVPRDGEGRPDFGTVEQLGRPAIDAFNALAEDNDRFGGASPPVKTMTFWIVPSLLNVAGIYFPFTGESNVNPDAPDSTLPFTICHEMAHRLGFAPEDEANYVAFLACRASDLPMFRYAAYLEAFLYCGNALGDETRREVMQQAGPPVRADIALMREHYMKYEGPLRQIGESINHGYLVMMGQPEGVGSYGMVVDLLLAEYAKEGRL